MTVYALWYGGSSYGESDPDTDLEAFPSLSAAGEALRARYERGYAFRQHFEFVRRDPESVFCPAVSESTRMLVYLALDRDERGPCVHENGPDVEIKLGPGGAARIKRLS